MLGAICRRFGGWSLEKLEYWYGKLGLHYRIMVPWRPPKSAQSCRHVQHGGPSASEHHPAALTAWTLFACPLIARSAM
jgi:hypothetical protein